jgi:diguanylate cyclase (GGDEF)-like protein
MGTGHAAPVDDTVVQEILGTGVPMIVNDLEAYLEENSDSEPTRLIVSEGMRSSLTCPLAAAGKPVGLMVFSSKEPNTYDEDHRAMLEHIAEHVATILERSRLYERLGELNWQLRIAKDALEYQATHDGLTRLYNRSAILDTAEQEMERAGRRGRPITIVMCDIDHFKAINDAHGHLVGDRVLQAVADRLKEALRSYETVGRYGGEEFLITLYDCDAEGAPHAMERLRTAVGGEGIETTKGVVNVSISLGAAAGNGNEADLDTFIRLADEAMYEAKEAGRDRYAVRVVEGDDR